MRAAILLLQAASLTAALDLDSAVHELTTSNFEKTNEGLWLLKFYAPWCGHCKKLAPTYEKVANYFHRRSEGDVNIAKIDATEHPGLASRFDIKGYPTLMLYRDGAKVADYSGARTFDAIVAWIEQNEGKGGGAPAPPAKATSRGDRASGRAAKAAAKPAGPGMRVWLQALLTEHNPVTVGLWMLGFGGICSLSLLVFIVAVSPRPN